jgi:class 3 adenylate cyclase/tetratricopeptide (TPR) repeat protein
MYAHLHAGRFPNLAKGRIVVLSDWIDRVRAAEKSGDLIVAYDSARQGLTEHPNSVDLRYLATRVLARSGATEEAAALYKRFHLDRELELDIAMLGARIIKDRALGTSVTSVNRRVALRAAAAAYVKIADRTRDPYPCVNAATLYLLLEDYKRAQAYARRALEFSKHSQMRTSIDRYYHLVTRAEAALVCQDIDMAYQALGEAVHHQGSDFDAVATTRKQLRLLCRAIGTNTSILDILRPPSVLHYDGFALSTRGTSHLCDRHDEREFIHKIVDHLTTHRVGYAYGSLTVGGDILCAEACLQANIELHVVLPFGMDEFVKTMIRRSGPSWTHRFKTCLARAKSVTLATTDSYQGDNELFTYGCRLAMGMAILRARHLDARVSHLKLQADGSNRDTEGYAASMRMWRAQGHSSTSLALKERPTVIGGAQTSSVRVNRTPPRVSRALLFGDAAGFSRTPDSLNPVFQKRFMGAIAAVLKRYRRHVLYRNSWGDAIYVVMDDPVVAAKCGLAIQEAITRAKLARFGIPELALRLAGHFGPVYDGHDPIRNEPTFFGAHTTLVARIEPVTPPGYVYVTEAMAAAIAMANTLHLSVEYVGNVPMAKGFGSTRMYSLKRIG